MSDPDSVEAGLLKLVEQIASQQGLELEKGERERILNHRIGRLKKVWAICRQRDSSEEKVLLKILPSGSIISADEFKRTETVEAQITHQLKNLGVSSQETLQTQFDHYPKWIVRQFIEGDPVGDIEIPATVEVEELMAYITNLREKLDTIAPTIDQRLLNHHDWQQKWRDEFQPRKEIVAHCLGQPAADWLEQLIERPVRFAGKETLLHSDLAPPNIIKNGGGFTVIDWGEAAVGPAAIDWAVLWSFAVQLPKLQQRIVELVVNQAPTPAEQNEAKDIILALGARMMANFAESRYYAKQESLQEQTEQVLAQAWRNIQSLASALNK